MTISNTEIIDSLEDWAGSFIEEGKHISPYELLDKLADFEART